jgi:hypothetical protein
VPGCGDRREAARLRKRGGGDRHRAAEAIADQQRRLAEAADEGKGDPLDMPGNGEVAARFHVPAPVEQEDAEALVREPAQQRLFRPEVEDARRVDERGDEEDGRPAAAIIAQARAVRFHQRRHRLGPGPARRLLIGAKAGERPLHPLRVAGRLLAQQIEEEG